MAGRCHLHPWVYSILPADFFSNDGAFIKDNTREWPCEGCGNNHAIMSDWWYGGKQVGNFYKTVCESCGYVYDIGQKISYEPLDYSTWVSIDEN